MKAREVKRAKLVARYAEKRAALKKVLTRHRSVRLAPIAEDSRLQPPAGVWAVSQSQCG